MEGKETTLKELGEMLAHVVKHMATKDELKEFRDEFKVFREETAENFRALRAEVAAFFDSVLRLLGAANATGAIAAGAAFHAFEKSTEAQASIKWTAVFFLFGVLTFVVAYVGWFLATLQMDASLRKPDDPPELLAEQKKSPNELRISAKRDMVWMLIGGLVSFACFAIGLAKAMVVAILL